MRSSFSSKNTSSQNCSSHRRLSAHWRMLALSCAAVGGVGVLWLPGSAQSPAIIPADDMATEPMPFVAPLPEMTQPAATATSRDTEVTVPAPRALVQQESRISIEMRDAPVIDLLMLIAGQGSVDITIGSDVESTLRIPGIRLTDVTPADAIREAATTAGLRWKKLDDKTYFVGKTLPDHMGGNSSSTSTPGAGNSSQGIAPIDNTWLEVRPQPLQNPLAPLPSYNSGSQYSNSLVPLNNRTQGQEKSIRPIQIRNVRSTMMAYWLDPQNQELPIEIQASEQAKKRSINPYPLMPGVDPNVMSALNGNSSPSLPFVNPYATNTYANSSMNANAGSPWSQPAYRSNFLFGGGGGGGGFGGGGGGGGQGGGGGLLTLGTDEQGNQLVDQIVSIDAQNVLLVYGTDEGIRRLNQIIEFLDRPIRQVEIESQFIDIAVTDAKAFGLQFFSRGFFTDDDDITRTSFGTIPIPGGANTLVFNRGNIQARLQALASSGRARVINSPRVTTMNNLTASLVSQSQTPVVLTSTETSIGGQVGQQQNAFFLTTAIGIQVTPTIQNDDTVTVFLTPQVSVQIPSAQLTGPAGGGDDDNPAASIPAVSSQFLTTVANVKDNDVIVLGGLRTRTQNIIKSRIPVLSNIPILGRLFRSQRVDDTDRELVIFLTARILRRSDDITPIQGP